MAVVLSSTGEARAQEQTSTGRPVVQALPGPETMRLNTALTSLARNPGDVSALIEAGEAAMALGDFDAAQGFFRRATDTQSGNGRAMAGLASALTMGGDPYAAIPLFEQAQKAGADSSAIAADRGLAYDLVGANALAQEQYRQVLSNDTDGQIRRRMALSQAIGGDGAAAELTLLPLLRAQDKPAWRTRAFVLAVLGKTKEAAEVTNVLLPAGLAKDIAPYLRYMPQLTPAQQAAAANLGRFPRASEIGRDDPRIAAFESLTSPRTRVAAADAALVPKGEPLGNASKQANARGKPGSQAAEDSGGNSRPAREKRSKRDTKKAERAASSDDPRVAPPEPRPARESTVVSQPTLAPAVKQPVVRTVAEPVPEPAARQPESKLAMVTTAQAMPPPEATASSSVAAAKSLPSAATPAASMAAPSPGFDLARLPSSAASQVSSPQSAGPAAAPSQAQEPGFAETFGDIGKPTARVAPTAGAVDVRKIEPAKPKPKPAPPSHPSRIWVQLGIGRDVSALRFDWRRLTRRYADEFKGREAWVSDLGKTNRMLTGPFESRKSADEFLAELAKAGFEGPYLWISPAGQVVEPL